MVSSQLSHTFYTAQLLLSSSGVSCPSKYHMRIPVTLAQDSPPTTQHSTHSGTHGILLSRACWHVNQKEFEFTLSRLKTLHTCIGYI
jgi:hypothetical protein